MTTASKSARLAVAFAGALAAQSAAWSNPPAASPDELASANPLSGVPVSTLTATRDRPLFSASRRPSPKRDGAAPAPPAADAEVKAAPPVAAERPAFALTGTIIGDAMRMAIVSRDHPSRATAVREGERAEGWTLQSVGPRAAVFEIDGRAVTLNLPQSAAAAGVAPAASDSYSAMSPRKKFLRRHPHGL